MKQLVPVLVSVQYNKLSWCAEKDLDVSLKHHQNETKPGTKPSVSFTPHVDNNSC